jgi:drug/metabolite transporter (DMT)-like permease
MRANTGPILIAVLAGLFLAEGFPPRLIVGCLIAFAGTVVIGLATSGAPLAASGAGTRRSASCCVWSQR